MIGKLTLPNNMVATLEDNNEWTSDDENIMKYLNMRFSPNDHRFSSPANGRHGAAAIIAAANLFKAKYAIKKLPPGKEGTIY